MQNIKMIKRDKSVVTGKKNLKKLYTFKKFPVFFGCVDTPAKDDLLTDMSWAIDRETGVIQLDKLVPLEILYKEQHVDGTGPTWAKYYEDFAKYLMSQKPKSVLEIGGGAGKLAQICLDRSKKLTWMIVEPNPIIKRTDRLKVVDGFFETANVLSTNYDCISFSQLLEHIYDPMSFLESISKSMNNDSKFVFAYPNLEYWLSHKFTNALNFEHTMFLTDTLLDWMIKMAGMKIVNKSFYKNHSVFYSVVKSTNFIKIGTPPKKYAKYKKYFEEYVDYHKKTVLSFNRQMKKYDSVYLFGAHIFSQYLINFGLDMKRILGILDNSPLKQGRRLYGTDYIIESPEILRGKKDCAVILKVGIYRDEIYKQIKTINPNLDVIE
jgi:2-polyprenyl-3-methyl-5-hydroxy-6-metoxy-1,4-benzoquinol methylase